MESENLNISEHYMNPLFTDFYQVTMMYAYWKNGRHNEHAVFEAFFRKCPFKGKFAIFAGLEEVLQFIKELKFTDVHIKYLKKQIPQAEEEFFDYLKGIDGNSITVNGIKDGTIVFGKQPLLSIHGPIAVVQLIETPVLNLINFATLVCTNAARMKLRAGKNVQCIEFGLRRAQGPNGALSATKYSFMGGFEATSNVYAGLLYDIPIKGTIAHSFIMSFENEAEIQSHHHLDGKDVYARVQEIRQELGWTTTNDSELYSFISFACSYPSRFLCLIDTFNTVNSGCKNFLIVAVVLSELGYKPSGVRLDSGDLAGLSKECRKLFIEVGEKYGYDYSKLTIVASDDINEDRIREFNEHGHSLDVLGIGTNLVTCQAQPALGMVYKLVEIEGRPRIKLSEEKEKVLIPGCKKIFRVYENESPSFDILLLDHEEDLRAGHELTAYHPFRDGETITIEAPTKIEKITEKLYDKGEVTIDVLSIHEKRTKVLEQLDNFNPEVVHKDSEDYVVYLSKE